MRSIELPNLRRKPAQVTLREPRGMRVAGEKPMI